MSNWTQFLPNVWEVTRHNTLNYNTLQAPGTRGLHADGISVLSRPFPHPLHPSPPAPVPSVIQPHPSPSPSNVFSHCPTCHSLELYWQHVLRLTSVGTPFFRSKTKIQSSDYQLHILQPRDNLTSVLTLATEFLSSARFLKHPDGVSTKNKFHPAASLQLPFPSPLYSRKICPDSCGFPTESAGFPSSQVLCRSLHSTLVRVLDLQSMPEAEAHMLHSKLTEPNHQ